MLNASMGKKEESQRLTFQFLFVPCRQLLSVLPLCGAGRLVGPPDSLTAQILDDDQPKLRGSDIRY